MILEALETILREQCTADVVRAVETGGSPEPLWSAIADAGFLELLLPEAEGGAGLSLAEWFPIVALLGRYLVPLPVAQSMAARALLPKGGVPAGRLTLAPAVQRSADGGWLCAQVPFGLIAQQVLVDDGQALWLLPADAADKTPVGIRGSQLARLRWPASAPAEAVPRPGDGLRALGAALLAAQMAGSMTRVFEMSLQYGNDRVQFGKSIGKFQSIQHSLSVMAERVAMARMAAQCAFRGAGALPGLLISGIAKARTSEAVVDVTATAHAVHGAIGVTEEFDLQLHTRRLHEWRLLHGSEAYWHPLIGQALLDDTDHTVSEFARNVVA